MRATRRTTSGTKARRSKPNDAFRVLLALVFILFASMASRDGDSPEKVQEARAVAQAKAEKRARKLEEKRKISSDPGLAPNFTHINGSI